jgi:hypothetical protein
VLSGDLVASPAWTFWRVMPIIGLWHKTQGKMPDELHVLLDKDFRPSQILV